MADTTKRSNIRIGIGIAVFILGQLATTLVPIITKSDLPTHWKTVLAGFLLIGVPELCLIAAVAIMGKDGYNFIKSKIFKFLGRFAPADHVSKRRYQVGLVLFIIPIVFAAISPYAMHIIPAYNEHIKIYAIAGDALLIISLFILGGDFFDKLRSLFIYKSVAIFKK